MYGDLLELGGRVSWEEDLPEEAESSRHGITDRKGSKGWYCVDR